MFSHPGTLTYSPQRNGPTVTRKFSEMGLSPGTPTTSAARSLDFNWKSVHHAFCFAQTPIPVFSCQLEILSALQGVDHNHDSRQRVAAVVESMDDTTRSALIDFLLSPNGAVAVSLENNACKHFKCTPEELDGLLDVDCVEVLLQLWDKIYLHILPNFTAMVYDLEKRNPVMCLRRRYLTFFRDKVLMRVLSGMNGAPNTSSFLYSLLFIIDVQTINNSAPYWRYKELMCTLLGLPFKSSRRLSGASDNSQCMPSTPTRTTTPKKLSFQASDELFHAKSRSNTMSPKRSVHWSDNVTYDFDEASVIHI